MEASSGSVGVENARKTVLPHLSQTVDCGTEREWNCSLPQVMHTSVTISLDSFRSAMLHPRSEVDEAGCRRQRGASATRSRGRDRRSVLRQQPNPTRSRIPSACARSPRTASRSTPFARHRCRTGCRSEPPARRRRARCWAGRPRNPARRRMAGAPFVMHATTAIDSRSDERTACCSPRPRCPPTKKAGSVPRA